MKTLILVLCCLGCHPTPQTTKNEVISGHKGGDVHGSISFIFPTGARIDVKTLLLPAVALKDGARSRFVGVTAKYTENKTSGESDSQQMMLTNSNTNIVLPYLGGHIITASPTKGKTWGSVRDFSKDVDVICDDPTMVYDIIVIKNN